MGFDGEKQGIDVLNDARSVDSQARRAFERLGEPEPHDYADWIEAVRREHSRERYAAKALAQLRERG